MIVLVLLVVGGVLVGVGGLIAGFDEEWGLLEFFGNGFVGWVVRGHLGRLLAVVVVVIDGFEGSVIVLGFCRAVILVLLMVDHLPGKHELPRKLIKVIHLQHLGFSVRSLQLFDSIRIF